jgi:signal transduction histidine kinase
LLVERLKTIGRVADGVAGDLRQSLSVIRNSVYFLNTHLGESLDDRVRRHLGLMLQEVNSLGRIASNLTFLSPRRVPERHPVDMELLLAGALGQVTVPRTITVETVVPAETCLVCDAEHMTIALANLITNAVQAMTERGRLRLVCRVEPNELTLAVTDNGAGMTDETRARAFEPLFSTSPHRAGLGLPVVRALVGANGGTVALESRPAGGTTALLRFPRFA